MTINLADINSAILEIYNGNKIDISHILPVGLPEYSQRVRDVSKNPWAAAKYFDTIIQGFFKVLLRHGQSNKRGILGKVKDYYGTVETQGRGSLHLHLLIWVDLGGTFKEFFDKLSDKD